MDRGVRPAPAAVTQSPVHQERAASEALTAAVVGFVVALVTSLSVSLACVAYLW